MTPDCQILILPSAHLKYPKIPINIRQYIDIIGIITPAMPCLLPSKPNQSFRPITISKSYNANDQIFLVSMNSTDIIFLSGTQIVVFDSKNFSIKDEILLDFKIDAFTFDPKNNLLLVKLDMSTEPNFEDKNTNFPVADSPLETAPAGAETETASHTVTGKFCSWSLNCSHQIFSFSFSHETCQLTNCQASSDTGTSSTPFISKSTTEIVKNHFLAQLTNCKLLISDKNDRNLVFTEIKLEIGPIHTLIWIKNDIFIFTFTESGHLRILKYSLVQLSPPTNGCNAPLITWSNDVVNVHRAGTICPFWYKLKNNEVWDVLNSPVGNVSNVLVSAQGTCLLVSGDSGLAFCDFFKRSWRSLTPPFQNLIHPKWLGDSHVVALTPDINPQLILISRHSTELLAIPVPEPQTISFIDTYNNWQLLLQSPGKIDIYAFEGESTCNFTFVKAVPYVDEDDDTSYLKQAAFFKNTLFTLNSKGNLCKTTAELSTSIISENCESFLVLSTGHILLHLYNQTSSSYLYHVDESKIVSIGYAPISVLPFTNCCTTLSLADKPANFSLNSPIQSKFLLPILFSNAPLKDRESLLFQISESNDPLYPLTLEYILLECLGDANSLEILNKVHSNDLLFSIMSKAISSLTRKIEAHEASHKLLNLLPSFSPLAITKSLSLPDQLNFLPYLAKSYFENVDNRKEAIILILESLFSKRCFYDHHIEKVKEYLEAFSDLNDLFKFVLKSKIETLWKSGRVFKAYELIKHLDEDTSLELTDCFDENDPVYRIDSLISSNETHESFHSWLKTRMIPKLG